MAAIAFPQARQMTRPTTRSSGTRAVYRRRRVVVAVLFLGVLLAGSWALGALGGGPLTASEADSPARAAVQPLTVRPVARVSHIVQPGETLWSIARALQPEGDIRPLVDSLAAARGGRALQPGERIELPSGAVLQK